MSEDKLRDLLREAREFVALFHEAGCPDDQCEGCAAANDMTSRIDAALAEPVLAAETNYYAEFNAMRDKAAKYGLEATQMRKERDEARAEVARLRWGNEMACENTPTKGCECPGCGLARERAERGEDGP